ncbi:hypothetical protein CMO88_00490 [Candidatus Woesearchaeota archaeon]|nr:hypothetical protein [Candidatus Woesearchaeota archaeon]|tara:strand:+ start:33146 stop:33670 length:525 start_codon:yes stop_codon:yes gene_type:complete
MHIWLHKLELAVDKIIGPLLVALLLVIIGELFFSEQFEPYHAYADYFDMLLISVFTIDLTFKFNRVRNISKFLKSYWLQIIAIIPFFFVFRLTEFLGLRIFIERGQEVIHEAPEIQKLGKEGTAIVREVGQAGRSARFIRTFRVISRLPRFLKAVPFFETPTGKHHPHEKKAKK